VSAKENLILLYALHEKNGIHSVHRDEVPEVRAFFANYFY